MTGLCGHSTSPSYFEMVELEKKLTKQENRALTLSEPKPVGQTRVHLVTPILNLLSGHLAATCLNVHVSSVENTTMSYSLNI